MPFDINDPAVQDVALNMIEMVIRNYDFWLSCAAHITVIDEHGKEIAKKEIFIGTS
jgi:coenzyme F420-reducing hydrogenase alpha subunit